MSEYTEMIIFLYSKQCLYSMNILKQINNVNITKISVDHPVIRKKILSSTNIQVEKVPCFISLSDTDGNVEITVFESDTEIEEVLQELLQNKENTIEEEEEEENDTIEKKHTPLSFDVEPEQKSGNSSQKPYVFGDTTPLENINPTTLTSVIDKGPKKSAQELAKEMQKQREEMFSTMKNNKM